jgi:hypothetical protein
MPDTEIDSSIALILDLAGQGNNQGLWALIDDILEVDASN